MSDNPFKPDHLYRISDFAERASLSERQVYNLLHRGVLRARKIGAKRTAITNAAEWYETLPAFSGGEKVAA